ncbi:MAG: MFS transporter [Thermoguttaceae bacterium]|nr:MFS transporter [Thermoguttaceae bacterium]
MTETKPVSPWKQTIIASMTSYIDAGSIVAGAAGLALWEKYLQLESWQTGLLTMCSSNAIGAAIGALIGGVLCDKFGRKFVYTYDLLVYMFGMLFIVFGVSTPQTVFDFGSFSMSLGYILFLFGYLTIGLAVGADVVASWTLIAEQAPAENRARHCGSAQVFWAVGPAVVLLMQSALSFFLGEENALLGNRIVFGHLIVVAFVVWLLRLGMPESDNWKKAKEQEAALIASGKVKRLGMINLLSPTNLKTVLFLCGVYVIWNLAAGTMGMLLPYIYQNVGGISNSLSCALTVILFVASAISTLTIFMALGDRISRRLIYCVIALFFVIAWGLFLLPDDVYSKYQFTVPVLGTVPLIFVLISILMGINNGSGQQAFYQLWCNELFPSHYRASAQGFTFFMARITVGAWTACVPVIMGKNGENFATAAAIMVGFALFSMLVGTIFAPNTAGKTLEQIEEERYGK